MSKLFEVKVSVFIITESESEARDYVESIIDDENSLQREAPHIS